MYGGDFAVDEDGLVDYNDLDSDTKEQQSSHTPVQTPQKLDSESEGDDEVKREEAKRDLEEARSRGKEYSRA